MTSEEANENTDDCGEKIVNITGVSVDNVEQAIEDLERNLSSFWSTYSASVIISVSNVIFPIFFEVCGFLLTHKSPVTTELVPDGQVLSCRYHGNTSLP